MIIRILDDLKGRGTPLAARPVVVARPSRVCKCGRPFSGPALRRRCPVCRKKRRLLEAAARPQSETDPR